MTLRETYIYCAGVDYFRTGLPLQKYARARAKTTVERVAKKQGKNADVWILDFGLGRVERTELRWVNGELLAKSEITRKFTAITRKSYGREGNQYHFKDGQTGVMSVVDLYSLIVGIGETNPNSIKEVSIFSHGWYGGPSIVNSIDNLERNDIPQRASTGLRDPDDKDCRAQKDFNLSNPPIQDRNSLKKSFSKDGYFWIWGCNEWPDLHNLMRKIEVSKGRKDPITKEPVISLRGLTKQQIEMVLSLNGFLKVDATRLKRAGSCEFKQKSFNEALLSYQMGSYAYQLTSNMGIKTISALVGTYAVPDKSRGLMKIAGYTVPHVKYYLKHLSIGADHEGRNYGVLEPGVKYSP